MPPRPASRGWFWAALALTAAKLWLVTGQRIFGIGSATHDDLLFVKLAGELVQGHWLGAYGPLTLVKGPMYSIFIALAFQLGVPLLLAQQALYAAACGALVRSLRPWLRPGAAAFALYAVLLWNPMSFEAENLGRVMRQHIYTPLALLTVAGLVAWFARRRESVGRQARPAAWAGLAFGCFWLTREESVWLVPGVALLLAAPALALRQEWRVHGRALLAAAGVFLLAALLPILTVCTLNYRHYGWFGTVEFRAPEFNAAYGALMRPRVGPELAQVPVTRQMREALYAVSPTFARLRPHLEGPVGDHWIDRVTYPAAERQFLGGWFVWALRDAVWAAGEGRDPAAAMRFYQQVADEVNAACDAGRIPARPPRSGFLPPLRADDARPLFDNAIGYTTFFVLFRDFTAYAPDSMGDYADLKPFRDIVGTRLTPAPRSPEPPMPGQDERNARKVAALQSIGDAGAATFAWLGPLVLLVGAIRAIESLAARRVSYPLGLAGALLAACGAYVAINVLVQVTSYYNMSPAALAPAYPLYLVALAAIVVDAVTAWRVPVPASAPTRAAGVLRPVGLAATGAALVVFGARLAEIFFFASDVPYNDQWVIEADQILAPWVNGTLGLGNFFIPHFEHLPVWTRLLAWLQVAVTGRWDPLVQMTTNAALFAIFVGLVVAWVGRNFRPVPAALATLLLVAAGALPHAWENITWGFQSQFPVALLFLFIYVRGTCTCPAGSRGWWLAQAAAVAAFFTLASLWTAPLAVAISWLWTGPRRRELVAPAALAAVGALLLYIVHRTGTHTFAQVVVAPLNLLHSALHLLGWPSPVPGAVALVQLPWVVHALRLRGRADAAAVDRIIFVLGLWGAIQAVAIAFGRVGDNADFVSRYGDLFLVSTLAGALALVRLAPAGGRSRTVFLGFALVWSAVIVAGLVRNSTEGHAHYFHLHAAERREIGRQAVQDYLKAGDRTLLDSARGRAVFLEDTPLVARMLDDAKLRALLPAPVNPATAPDAIGTVVRRLQSNWDALMIVGLLLFAAGSGVHAWWNRGVAGPDPLVPRPDPWRWWIPAIVGGLATALSLAWSNPVWMDAAHRWRRSLGGDEAVQGIHFSFAGPSEFGNERLQGAAPISPVPLRDQFYGTAPAGPELMTVVVSSRFPLTQPWLVVPYAGYPTGNGNGLRLRIVDAQGNQVGDEIGCPGPGGPGVLFWTIDVRAHAGRQAMLILYDGRPGDEGWVAVAPPVPTADAQLADSLTRRFREEEISPMQRAVVAVAVVALAAALLSWWGQRRTAQLGMGTTN